MTFSNKIYKLKNGQNLTLFCNQTDFFVYIFDSGVDEFKITFNPNLTISQTVKSYDTKYAKRISNDLILLCYDENMSLENY